MKIPAFLYGPYAKVKIECRRKAKELRRGASFDDLPGGQWVDTASVPGALVLDGLSRTFPHQEEHFCCFALALAITSEWRTVRWAEVRDTVFAAYHEAAMHEPWPFLGVMGQQTGIFLVQRPDWSNRFVHAAVKFWPTLDAEGTRFTSGLPQLTDLWSVPTNLKIALGQLGVPVEKLRAPLPAGGLPALVRETLPDLEST